jgi:serine protease AprX
VFNTPSPDFLGVAPDARIVNIKVGANDGSVDVSQVIAAIDWVVQHRNDNGLNIRVLNLSFGTDSTQKYNADPLSYAVEQAWNHGIVVVVSAGNDGNGAEVRNPALNPFVITVGSVDTAGTYGVGDDVLSGFSNCGNARHPDLVAPGKSIVSLRTPGATSDVFYPSARVGSRLFRGTGTSQAAAVVSGAAALLIDQRPSLTPNEVKAILTGSARALPGVSSNCQGSGLLDLSGALTMPTPSKADQGFKASKGNGSLDSARGSHRLSVEGKTISGEVDIHGQAWNPSAWASAAAQGVSWSGGDWNGVSWSGVSWSGVSWSGVSWSGVSWSGVSWSGVSWSGTSWSGVSWSGVSWSGTSWSGTSWSGTSWSGTSWSDESWTGGSWS